MHRFVKEHIRDDYLVKIPHQMATRHMKNGEQHKIPIILTTTQGVGKPSKITDDDGNLMYERAKNPVELSGTIHHQPLDFDDLCDHMKITKDERQVIDWSIGGYSFRDMAKMWGVSHQTVKRIMDRVKGKLRDEFDYTNLRKDSNVSTNEAGR